VTNSNLTDLKYKIQILLQNTASWSLVISHPTETGGWVGLSDWLHTSMVDPQMITHLSTNWDQCRGTSSMKPVLPLCQAVALIILAN